MRHWMGILLVASVLLWGSNVLTVEASEVAVGDQTVQVVDSLARIEDWFGRPAIEIYLFQGTLTDEQKSAIAAKKYPKDKDFEDLAAGNHPVMNLLVFFDKDLQECMADKLVSYTAVFKQNPGFSFGSPEKGPINWAFTRGKNQSLASIGIEKIACSFVHGEWVEIKVKKNSVAQREQWGKILPAGVDSLEFKWDINIRSKIINPDQSGQ